MAFCVRSERKMDYYKKDIINPGPGQYFQHIDKQKIKKRIHPPFNTSGQRSSFIKKEEIPGPGSYDLIDKSLCNNKDISFNTNNNNNNQKEEENIKYNFKTINDKTYNNISTINKNNKSSFYYNTINNNSFSNIVETSTLPYNNNSIKIKRSNSIVLGKINNDIDNYNILNNSSNSGKLGFLSQATRFNDKNIIIKINEPGPGTYEAIDYTKDMVLKNNKKKSKSERKLMKASLKIDAGSLNRIISIPSKIMNGYTFIGDKNNNLIDKNNKTFSVIDNNKKINKENYFSNMRNINKEYKLIIDKNSNFGKNMPTSEYVGPGSYDIYIKEKGNSVINWSRGFNLREINNKKELLKTQRVFDEMKRYGDTVNNFIRDKKINILSLCKTNSVHFLVGKNQRGLNDLNKKMLDNNINNKINDSYYCRDSFIQDRREIPGPGYYSKELIDHEKDTLYYREKEKQKIEEKKLMGKKLSMSNYRKVQCGEEIKLEGKFGSNCGRFIVKSKSMEDLGPTTYFIEKNKYEPNKKPEILKHLKTGKLIYSFENRDSLFKSGDKGSKKNINNKEKESNLDKVNDKENKISKNNTFMNKSLNDNPGPGEYELSHSFLIPSFSQISMMNSHVERFPNIEEQTPGPGSYINKDNLENEKIQEKIKKIINFANYDTQNIEKMKRIENIKELNRKRNDFPGAGTYNPGLQNTINYKMKSKINPRQSYQSPFLISSERFKYFKDDRVSPAVYDPYKYDKKQNNLQYMVFGKAKRFLSDLNDENMKGVWHMAGPGSYDVDNSWNKKTYNVLFSGNQ